MLLTKCVCFKERLNIAESKYHENTAMKINQEDCSIQERNKQEEQMSTETYINDQLKGLIDFLSEHIGASSGVVTGAGLGAYVGSGLGIAAGPLGAFAGTVPCATIGAALGFFAGDKIDEIVTMMNKGRDHHRKWTRKWRVKNGAF